MPPRPTVISARTPGRRYPTWQAPRHPARPPPPHLPGAGRLPPSGAPASRRRRCCMLGSRIRRWQTPAGKRPPGRPLHVGVSAWAEEYRDRHRPGLVAQLHDGGLHGPVLQRQRCVADAAAFQQFAVGGRRTGIVAAIGRPGGPRITWGQVVGTDEAVALVVDQNLQHAGLTDQPHRLHRAERRKLAERNQRVALRVLPPQDGGLPAGRT